MGQSGARLRLMGGDSTPVFLGLSCNIQYRTSVFQQFTALKNEMEIVLLYAKFGLYEFVIKNNGSMLL